MTSSLSSSFSQNSSFPISSSFPPHPLRVAVIGVGSMGQNHARVYFHHDNAQLVAVADNNEAIAAAVARKYNAKAYADYNTMLDTEAIDVVSIVVPTSLHKKVALDCLRRNKHVLLEKPIAPTIDEAQEIIICAKEHHAKLMVGHIERFNTAIVELKRRLENNELGEIYKIHVQRIGPFPARVTDVGVITDLSVHDLDIINYLMNSPPARIYAEIQQKLHPHHEDSVTALVRYANDVLAVLNINYLSPTKIRELQVFGKKGMFAVNYLDQQLFFFQNNSFAAHDWESISEGDMKRIMIQKKEPLQAEIDAFLDCVRNGSEPPVTGEQALQTLRLANHLLAAAKEKRIIEL